MDRIFVVGAGGIGCAVGYALRAAGRDVVFIDADEEKVAWGREHGVVVERRPPLPAQFELFASWSPPAGATVLLCTKCYDNAAVLARLPEDVSLIPIQNGFDRALNTRAEGIASFVSECLPHRTHTRITRPGKLHLGPLGFRGDSPSPSPPAPLPLKAGGEGSMIDALAHLLHGAGLFRVKVVGDILPYKHTKLMYNAAVSPIAAAAGMDNGGLLSVPSARRLFFAILRENYAILKRANKPLATIGPFHPDTVHGILRRPFVANLLAWAFYPSLRGTYCSMAGDIQKGRTEIDNYNGYLIDLAGGEPCPLNRAVHALVTRMAAGREKPRAEVLEGLKESEDSR